MPDKAMPRTQDDFNDFVAQELRNGDKRMGQIGDDLASVKNEMRKNTEAIAQIKSDTADMLATFESWQGAMKALEMIGRLAKPVGYIVGLCASLAAFYTAVKAGVGTR